MVDVKPFPSRPVLNLVCIFSVGSTFVLFVAALWQHTAAVIVAAMVPRFTSPALSTHVGLIAMALGWLGWTLITITAIAVVIMLLTVQMLSHLMDDDRHSDSGTEETELIERNSPRTSSSVASN